MKIGIISPYALPEKGAASMRVDSFQKYFIKMGHPTKIIAPLRKDNIDNSGNIRYNSFKSLRKEILNFDYIIITCPSFYTAFRIIPFLKLKNISFSLDMRDLAENTNRKVNLIFQLISIKLSKKITAVTQNMKDYVSEKYFVSKDKIAVISNGSDTKIFYPSKNREKMRVKLGIKKNEKLIVYEGIIGDHGLGEFLSRLNEEMLRKNKVKILLMVIVGETENKTKNILDKFMKTIESNKLGKFLFVMKNSQPEKLKDYISAGDFGLAPIPSDKKNLYRIPIKAYDYIACGVPILAKGPINGELYKLTKEYKCGYFFYDWESLIDSFNELKEIKIKKSICKNFERKKIAKKLLNFILK